MLTLEDNFIKAYMTFFFLIERIFILKVDPPLLETELETLATLISHENKTNTRPD